MKSVMILTILMSFVVGASAGATELNCLSGKMLKAAFHNIDQQIGQSIDGELADKKIAVDHIIGKGPRVSGIYHSGYYQDGPIQTYALRFVTKKGNPMATRCLDSRSNNIVIEMTKFMTANYHKRDNEGKTLYQYCSYSFELKSPQHGLYDDCEYEESSQLEIDNTNEGSLVARPRINTYFFLDKDGREVEPALNIGG